MSVFNIKIRYNRALYAAAFWAHRRKDITDEQFTAIQNTLQDAGNSDGSCGHCEQFSYNAGVDNGVIDANAQPLGTINWGNFLQFLTALLPLILQFIAIINPPKPPVPPTPSLTSGTGKDDVVKK